MNPIPFDQNAPASIESEMALLGSVLVNPDVFLNVAGFLKPDDFYYVKHQHIWSAMTVLSNRRMPIDTLTVAEELEAGHHLEAIGGMGYLAQLLNSTPSSVHAEFYGQIVERTAVRRRLMQAADEMKALARDEQLDLEAVISKSETSLFNVTERQLKRDFQSMRDVVGSYFDRIDSLIQNPGSSYGVPSGFRDLDSLLGGFQRQALMIFAGRPGMGKTSFLLSAAVNAARMGQGVAIFTMEMGAEELVQRIVAMETAISSEKLRRGELSPAEYNRFVEAAGRISDFPIYIDDTPGLNPIQLRTKARRLQHEFGLDLLIVDYLQLMNGGAAFQNNRVQEIGYISRSLKELARELNVPVFSAAQLSRAVESRQDKRPQLSDLRESGCLTGDTLIHLPDEGRYVPIAALVGQSGFRVNSLNTETLTLEPAEVSAAFSTGVKSVYRLRTRLGRTIRATVNHPFYTIHGWQRLDALAVGDRVAVPRVIRNNIAEQTIANEELALLGHLIGDGCTLPRHAIQYTTRELDLAQTVETCAKACFGDSIVTRIHQEVGHNWYQVFLTSAKHLTHGIHNPIRTWLDTFGIFGLRSHEKRVPDIVFSQPVPQIGRFLRHLWSTDGCIKADSAHPAVYYASSSQQLARDVQNLLLQLSINARLKAVSQGTKGRLQYHVTVSGRDDLALFVERVGAIGAYKSAHLEAVRLYTETTTSNTNRDVIPSQVWKLWALPSMQSKQITGRQLYKGMETAYAGHTLYKQNLSRTRAAKLALVVGSPEISRLATSDWYWDEITSIEPDGEAEVYDLTVPGNHNFVADNIVVHNSIEQDADVVMFLYRDVVYNQATEFPNQADVIVAKHRNGRTETISLYFDGSLTKFMD
nr:replicative DNA helicase [Anaerolineae bacterium]